jgi:hypothetical protein
MQAELIRTSEADTNLAQQIAELKLQGDKVPLRDLGRKLNFHVPEEHAGLFLCNLVWFRV